MREGLPKNVLGPGFAGGAVGAAFVTGLFRTGSAGVYVGEKQDTPGGREDQDEQPEVDITFHCFGAFSFYDEGRY